MVNCRQRIHEMKIITAIWTKVTLGEGGYVVLFNFIISLNFISL